MPPEGFVRALLWSASTALVTVVLAAAASAQTLPVPTLSSDQPEQPAAAPPTKESPATGAAAPTTPRPLRWEYGLGLGLGYDSNIDYRLPEGPSSAAIFPWGSLALSIQRARSQFRLWGNGDWTGYADQKDLSRYTAGFGLDGQLRSSLNTTWRAGASYDLGYGDRSQVLIDQGVLLGLVKTRTARGTLDVTRTLGMHTSLAIAANIYSVQFDQPDTPFGLVDGQSARGTATLQHRFSSRNALAILYSLQNTRSRKPQTLAGEGRVWYLTHFGSLQWNHVLNPESAFLLEAGASYTPNAMQAGLDRRESFFGGAAYRREIRSFNVMLFARREVTPAFGLGVSRVLNRFGLSTTIPMGRSWTARILATRSMPETPETAAFAYGTQDEASLALARRLGRHFEMSGEGRYRRRAGTDFYPEIQSYQVGLFLSLIDPGGGLRSRPDRRRR